MRDERRTRRRFLTTATAGLALGLAGCSGLSGSDQPSDSNAPASTPVEATGDDRTPRSTGTEPGGSATTGGSDRSGAQESGAVVQVESIPQLYSSTETTSYGIDLTNLPVMGAKDAPVDVYYWSDYQCPFCEQFESKTLPKVVEQIVAAGTARLIFLEFPNIGAASGPAAVMNGCVWRQVKDDDPAAFYRWHRTIYDQQGEPRSGWAETENLLDITRGVEGVDAAAVKTCMDERGGEMRDHVDRQVQAAKSSGVTATPSFVVSNREDGSGRKIAGAQPFPMFSATVNTVQ